MPQTDEPAWQLTSEQRLPHIFDGKFLVCHTSLPYAREVNIRPKHQAAKPLKIVSVGDSLSAGAQDASYGEERVEKSFGKQIADRLGVEYDFPEISKKGIQANIFDGNVLKFEKVLLSQLSIQAATAVLKPFLSRAKVPPNILQKLMFAATHASSENAEVTENSAVPGAELRHLTEMTSKDDLYEEIIAGSSGIDTLHSELPYVVNNIPNQSQIDSAIEQKPDLVTFWAGGNDIIRALGSGYVDDRTLTPLETRRWTVRDGEDTRRTTRPITGMIEALEGPKGAITRLLQETDAHILLLNMPDVQEMPLLRPVGEKVGKLPYRITALGVDISSKLENFEIPKHYDNGQPLPEGSQVTMFTLLGKLTDLLLGKEIKGLKPDEVIEPRELGIVNQRLQEYNDRLARLAQSHDRIHLVDTFAVTQEAENGLQLRGAGPPATVTNTYASQKENGHQGWFSLDGVHPSDIGHTVLANRVLDVVKKELSHEPRFQDLVNLEYLDEKKALREDPHVSG